MLPFDELPYLQHPDIVERRVREMLKIFRLAKKSIRIFSGDGYWIIFSHPYTKKIIREKHAEGVTVSISLGPIMSVWPDGLECDQKSPGILELADEGAINLFRRKKRGSHFHFIVVDDKRVWIENSHKPLASLYKRRYEQVKKDSPDFAKALRTFRKFSREKYRAKNPWEDFLLLFPSQIDFVCKSSPRFNMLIRSEIEKILANQ